MDELNNLLDRFGKDMLFVLDFSIISNIESKESLNILKKFFYDNGVSVAVSREFYENYEVVLKSKNDEQIEIASMAYNMLAALEKKQCLMNMSNIINSKDVVDKLHKNPKVCFVYAKYSEFAENVLAVKKSFFSEIIVENGKGGFKEIPLTDNEQFLSKAIIFDESGKINICLDYEEITSLTVKTIDPDAASEDYFASSFVPEKGVKVKTRDKQYIELGELIGKGGEGAVFSCIGLPNYVVKIYNKGVLNKLRLKKIFMMEKKQINYDGLCWPEKVVFSEKGEPVGYIMKKIQGESLDMVFDGSESVLKFLPNWTKLDSVNLAIDILQKIQYLHLFGIIIGDLRLKNIVIDKSGKASLVDLDSCQVDSLPCLIGFPDYTPPELQQINFKDVLRTYDNEKFSCSVLMFKILFCGMHPYNQCNGADTIEEDIRLMSFPYPEKASGDYSRIPWGEYSDMWNYTPVQFKQFLIDIFKNGNRYSTQQLILMLKTYAKFITAKKNKILLLNNISFNNK